MIGCRTISVLGRYVDATSSTPLCNCHDRRDCLNPCTATTEISKSSEDDTVKQITVTTTFQMILMMVLNKTMNMEVFLMTQLWTICMRGNKDKELKETSCVIFVCFVDLSVPSVCQLHHLIETHITYHITYDN